jgi:hypothetical protein
MLPGVRIGNCCPTPFLFQPTSVVMMASRGRTSRTAARMRSGRIGYASLRTCFSFCALNCVRYSAISLRSASFLRPFGKSWRALRTSARSACLRSATAPISTG